MDQEPSLYYLCISRWWWISALKVGKNRKPFLLLAICSDLGMHQSPYVICLFSILFIFALSLFVFLCLFFCFVLECVCVCKRKCCVVNCFPRKSCSLSFQFWARKKEGMKWKCDVFMFWCCMKTRYV